MRKFIRRTYKKFNQTYTKIIHVAKKNKQPPKKKKKEIVPPMKEHNKLIKSKAVAEKKLTCGTILLSQFWPERASTVFGFLHV